jgi:uncharacterized membrane protein YhiD involved in acid resistance
MTIRDILKKSVYDQYITTTADITVELLLITLFVCTILAVFLVWVYRFTFKGALYNASFATSLILTGMVTSLVILPISSNLTLSLGMVGALSIVRYRTAVKDPKDIAYMFWAIAIGLTCGAGFFLVAIAGTAFIAIVMVIAYIIQARVTAKEPCICVMRLKPGSSVDRMREELDMSVKSVVYTESYIEITAELAAIPGDEALRALRALPEVRNMSFVKYNGDYAL